MAGVDVDDTQLISVHFFFLYVIALNYYYFFSWKRMDLSTQSVHTKCPLVFGQ